MQRACDPGGGRGGGRLTSKQFRAYVRGSTWVPAKALAPLMALENALFRVMEEACAHQQHASASADLRTGLGEDRMLERQ